MSCLWHQGSPAGQEARLQPSSHLVQPLHIKFKRCETAAWGTGEADPTTMWFGVQIQPWVKPSATLLSFGCWLFRYKYEHGGEAWAAFTCLGAAESFPSLHERG